MAAETRLSHLDEKGAARMVDVSDKLDTVRVALAEAFVVMLPETLALIQSGGLPKGDVLAVARTAGIMGAKQTSALIPLCHQIALSSVEVNLERVSEGVRVTATARTTDKTGVEMEALTAATVAALTVYDMLKAASKGIEISRVRLLKKTGGKSGDYVAPID